MSENESKKKHFVLVHGLGHGAWCWYKLKPLLASAGHKVTVLDLAASGIDTQKIQDIPTFYHYSKPLLDLLASLPPTETVVLVGHNFGGMNIALAMENFPEKVSLGVFLSAFAPDPHHKPSHVLQEWILQDLELAKTLVRKGSLFPEELSEAKNFSREGYASVSRAYIVLSEDLIIPKEYQQWMIQNAGIHTVREINGADHMAMLGKTKDLCSILLEIADN
ncbi:Methylesterase 1 [Vigna angularis]|uniref:Methylesterase 1 n=1 Tax=Phaseolus angularis TaxID=3914 RepID=A0A8T0JM81_PHAAN|nr:Methylesterase 1 [Vigna angularis]